MVDKPIRAYQDFILLLALCKIQNSISIGETVTWIICFEKNGSFVYNLNIDIIRNCKNKIKSSVQAGDCFIGFDLACFPAYIYYTAHFVNFQLFLVSWSVVQVLERKKCLLTQRSLVRLWLGWPAKQINLNSGKPWMLCFSFLLREWQGAIYSSIENHQQNRLSLVNDHSVRWTNNWIQGESKPISVKKDKTTILKKSRKTESSFQSNLREKLWDIIIII